MNPAKPQGNKLSTAQAEVLATLRSVHPRGLTRSELVERCGHTATTRCGELRRLGWDIPANETRGGQGYYRLAALDKAAPDPTKAGCIIREGGRTGWTARTHTEAKDGPYPAEVLARAERAALDAYRAVLTQARAKVGTAAPVVVEEEFDAGFGWQPAPLPPEAEGWDGDLWGDDGIDYDDADDEIDDDDE